MCGWVPKNSLRSHVSRHLNDSWWKVRSRGCSWGGLQSGYICAKLAQSWWWEWEMSLKDRRPWHIGLCWSHFSLDHHCLSTLQLILGFLYSCTNLTKVTVIAHLQFLLGLEEARGFMPSLCHNNSHFSWWKASITPSSMPAHFLLLCWHVLVCDVISVVSNSLQHHRLGPTRLLCTWNSPGKNTGVNIGVHVAFPVLVSSGYMPRSGIPEVMWCHGNLLCDSGNWNWGSVIT